MPPWQVRIAAIANEKKRRVEQETARLEKQERDRQNYEKMAAMREEIATMHAQTMPIIEALAAGEGELSEQVGMPCHAVPCCMLPSPTAML